MRPLSLQGGVAMILLKYAKLSVLESYILLQVYHTSDINFFIMYHKLESFLISLAGSDGAALSISQTSGLPASQTGLLV